MAKKTLNIPPAQYWGVTTHTLPEPRGVFSHLGHPPLLVNEIKHGDGEQGGITRANSPDVWSLSMIGKMTDVCKVKQQEKVLTKISSQTEWRRWWYEFTLPSVTG